MASNKIKTNSKNFPKSCTSGKICLIGFIGIMISLYIVSRSNVNNYLGGVLTGLAFAVPIIIFEYIWLKAYKKSSTGLDFSLKNKINVRRVAIKLVGLYVTLGLVAIFYRLFPEYYCDFYIPYWTLVKYLLKIIIIGAIPYFLILDKFMTEPEDSYWKIGMIVLGSGENINYDGLKIHFLGWLIKAFFLPLMYISLCGNIGYMKEHPFSLMIEQNHFAGFFDYMNNYIFTVDLIVIFVGYILTLRIFDSHIRTVEPSFLGWYVALQCYQPIWGFFNKNYIAYESGYFWGDWLHDYHDIYILWGMIILFLLSIYSWASIHFGLRFSNLTNRGIVTNGPYRFTKHPAYVSKNLAWWFISIPFISQKGFLVASKQCILLLLLNLVYYLRAKTEERHLSQDPNYVQYALAMNEKGIFQPLIKIFRFLKYNPEKYYKENA